MSAARTSPAIPLSNDQTAEGAVTRARVERGKWWKYKKLTLSRQFSNYYFVAPRILSFVAWFFRSNNQMLVEWLTDDEAVAAPRVCVKQLSSCTGPNNAFLDSTRFEWQNWSPSLPLPYFDTIFLIIAD